MSSTPKVEAAMERMYTAMRAVINNAPLVATQMAIGACAGLTTDDEHHASITRLLVQAKLFPEMAAAAQRLIDLVIADKLEPIREAMVKG